MAEAAAELMPGLVLVHGNRAEQLRDVLVAWMRQNPLAPLENECLLVHSNGIAQWLRLALAQDAHGGIAAALDFLLPSRFMWQAYRSVLGAGAVPEDSPLDKDALVWRLMRLLPSLLDRPEYAVLQQFLADDADVRKRYQLAGRLADLFDQYQVYRADWLQAWSEGRPELPDGRGQAQELPATQAWQAHLWRALLDDLGVRAGAAQAQGADFIGRAAIHESFMTKVLAADAADRPAGLPRRILVFGISAMPRQTFEALAGLSRWVQVLVCVHNPCAHYWADILGDRDLLRARFRRQTRRPGMPDVLDDAALHQQTHPLLASWGRQGRDYIGMLDDFDDPAQRARWDPHFAVLHRRIDAFEELPGASLLAQLQDDIRDLRPLSETRERWPAADPLQDESIRFQVAHSAQREVEILQDQLLAAFQADPTLQPRDVIVMVPDIEAYAPHIQAVFGLYGPRDWRHIPYALADRSSRRADPLVIVLEQLLSLPRLRLGINEVLEWLEVPALRQRFGIAAEDLPLLQAWVRESQVRWGLHAEHRAAFELDQSPQAAHRHTWDFGLRRMLLGYAAGADAPAWQGIEPYDEPAGLQAAMLGGLAHFLDTLDHYWRKLSEPASPPEWGACLQALLDDFFSPDQDAEDALVLNRFREGLQDWLQQCLAADLREPLPAAIAAEHCLGWLDQGGLSQRFFAGAVTFATLMPMRAIPFRRVCLLGMQDGAFPRIRPPSDMDLMATHPRSGDRSRREDDRYLFLEALLSAREQLSISWVGHSIQDNAEQPPSVLVAQLREHLDRGWRSADANPSLADALTCRHPLQPFSRRYFPRQPAQGPQGLFTYAVEWRSAQQDAARSASDPAPADAPMELPPPAPSDAPLTLGRLNAFLAHPIRNFFQQRLQVSFRDAGAALDEDEPYVLDQLERWRVCQELMDAAAAAQNDMPEQDVRPDALAARVEDAVEQGLRRLRRRGDLVDGALGRVAADTLRRTLAQPLEAYVQSCAEWPAQVAEPVRLRSADGDGSFEDALAGWRRNEQGDWCRVLLQASQLVNDKNHYRFKALLGAWTEHVAAHALGGRSLTTVLISPKGRATFAPLAADAARSIWQGWLRGRRLGLRAALPLEIHAAGAWLRSGADPQEDGDAWRAAQDAYARAVGRDLYLRRCYPDFESLVRDRQFFTLARVLYGGLADSLPTDARSRASRRSPT